MIDITKDINNLLNKKIKKINLNKIMKSLNKNKLLIYCHIESLCF